MKRTHLYLILIIIIWAALQFVLSRPLSIVDDWLGWRQADTQTIARNFHNRGINLFYPQINWGGDGPGYVETELQLYPALISMMMKYTGEVEWAGQLLSLLFISITGIVLFYLLSKHYGDTAGLLGTLAFLTSQGPVHLSTSVQPDALALLFYMIGLSTFIQYAYTEKSKWLIASLVSTSLAALLKPTALCLGITQFVFVLAYKPKLLKNTTLWLAWAAILAIVGLYLFHAYNLYLTYGNTFGIFGGDSKFSSLRSFFMPWVYFKLSYMTLAWGMGIFGACSAGYLLWRRKFQSIDLALVIGYLFGLLVALRYTTNRGYGPHYHMFGTILGAWLVAHAFYELSSEPIRKISIKTATIVLSLLLLFQYGVNVYGRNHPSSFHIQKEVTSLGRELVKHVKSDDLIIVKSIADSRSEEMWGRRINNFEDPRIFYLANVRGWVVPRETENFEQIKEYVQRGARYYIEPITQGKWKELYDWLDQHSEVIYSSKEGRIYAFREPFKSLEPKNP